MLDADRLKRIRAAIVGASPEEEDAHFRCVVAEIERAEKLRVLADSPKLIADDEER